MSPPSAARPGTGTRAVGAGSEEARPTTATPAPAIEATGIEKSFGRTRAVDGASVTVGDGQLVALLGPSGSGKTTLLRTIAGFESPDAGTVSIGGRTVAGPGVWVEPEHRHIGMVFQDGALFPHLTVGKNVGFGGPPAGRVETCLELVGLADRARSYPHELSGGERQRVALARALATEPDVVLLDEPFGSLDAALRVSLREEVAAILRLAGASALFVTHDQQEALSLADVVAVMRAGRVEQLGTPEELYARPASRWVAEFLGDVDVLDADAADGVATSAIGRLAVDPSRRGPVEVLVRPEAVAVGPVGPGADRAGGRGGATGRVLQRTFYGVDQVVVVELPDGTRVRSRRPGHEPVRPGDEVEVWVVGPVTALDPPTSS